MDLEPIRAQWPEIEKSYEALVTEPTSAVVDRMKRRDARDRRRRALRQGLLRGLLVVLLGLAAYRLLSGRPETPVQAAAFMIALAAGTGLNLVDKTREKLGEPRFWLTPSEFRIDEHQRLGKSIRLDRWFSVLLGLTILSFAMYGVSFIPAGWWRLACWAVAILAVLLLQVYDHLRISQLKGIRDGLAEQPDELDALEDELGVEN